MKIIDIYLKTNQLDKGYIKLAAFTTKCYEDMAEDEARRAAEEEARIRAAEKGASAEAGDAPEM